MGKEITPVEGLTIGLDLGDKHTVGCVLTRKGEVEETFSVATTTSALSRTMAAPARANLVPIDIHLLIGHGENAA